MMLVIIILISDKVIIIENLFTASLITSHNSPDHHSVCGSVAKECQSAESKGPRFSSSPA